MDRPILIVRRLKAIPWSPKVDPPSLTAPQATVAHEGHETGPAIETGRMRGGRRFLHGQVRFLSALQCRVH